MAELHAHGVAAVLAADAAVQLRTNLLALLHSHLHQGTDAGLIQLGEGVVLEDLGVVVGVQELACVVTAEAVGQLGQVVGAEAEELRFLGDLVGSQAGAGNLDHGADLIVQLGTGCSNLGVRRLDHHVLDELQLLGVAGQGDHDFRHQRPVGVTTLHCQRRADDGLGLHGGDFGVGDRQTAAAVTHHGVELVQGSNDILDLLSGLALRLGQLGDLFLGVGDELVERGVQEPDGHGVGLHGLIQRLEVGLLHGQDLCQSGFPLLDGVGADHFPEGGDTAFLEEHVLGTAQADALGAQLSCPDGVAGGIGVGADMQTAVLVSPAHDAAEFTGDLRVTGLDDAVIDAAGGAVQTQPVAFAVGLARQNELLVFLVHLDLGAAGDAAAAHAAGNDGSVRGHTAADGEDALCRHHALDVLRRGLQTNQNHLFASVSPGLGVLSGEDDAAAGGSGRRGQRAANGLRGLQRLGVELGMEQGVQRSRLDHGNGLLLVDHALVHQIAGDLQSGGGGTLAVTGLEHIQLAGFHGELHVLHVVVVAFQNLADLGELGERLGELLRHFGDGHGGTDARHHVFALGVGQEFAEQLLLAGGRVAGESNAGAAVVTHVAEGHGLDVDGSAPGIGNVVLTTVNVGAGVVPGAEHGLDGAHQLLLGVGGEIHAQLALILGLELGSQLLQVVRIQLHVLGHALALLHPVDEGFKILLAHFHDHVGVHLDEPAVAVPRPAGIAGLGGHDIHHVLVQAQVQDGIHHAGHGGPGAGTDGNQQRVLVIAELLAGNLLQLVHVGHDLGLDIVVDLAAVFIIFGTGFRGNSKPLGDRQSNVGHFGQISAFSAQEFPHSTVSFGE